MLDFDKLDRLIDRLGDRLGSLAGEGGERLGEAASDMIDLVGASGNAARRSLTSALAQGQGAAPTAIQRLGFAVPSSTRGATLGRLSSAYPAPGQARMVDRLGFGASDRGGLPTFARFLAGVPGNATPAATPATAAPPGVVGPNTGADGASAWVQAQAPANSPIIAIADQIAQYAISRGVDPGLIFGKLRAESSWATNGRGPQMNNPGNIMAPGADPANGVIILRQYGSMLEGVRAMVDLLASYNQQYAAMFGKQQLSLEDMVAIYYVGPNAYKKYGLQANDAGGSGPGGNGTVQDYLNRHIYPVVQSYNARPGAQQQGGGTGLASLFGGTSFGMSQGFGRTDYSTGPGAAVYDFGTEFGLDGDSHTGWDIATPAGTRFYMPAGLSGVVTVAGGSGYYKDQGGDGPGRGELRILLDNGMELILGHNSAINVRAGQRITAGMLLGLTGASDGAHIHIELRRRDPSTRSGWRIIDPAALFGALPPGHAAGDGHNH